MQRVYRDDGRLERRPDGVARSVSIVGTVGTVGASRGVEPRPGRAGGHVAARDDTARDDTARDDTARDRTARDGTAFDGTARDGTARDDTASEAGSDRSRRGRRSVWCLTGSDPRFGDGDRVDRTRCAR